MNRQEARDEGIDNGYSIASENRADYNLTDEDERERFIDEMVEFESDIYRQYSPFEFFASAVNNSRYPDGVWQAYDNGVLTGIKRLVKEELNLIKNNHG